jgi:long-subunit fatty acid transport protein
MGLGGAFVAVADDATAAFSNPAGLVQLAVPELSMEFRHWSYSTPYLYRGRVLGEPSGFGLDTVSGLESRVSNNDLSGLAFLSFVYPKKRWSAAIYRHILAEFASSTETQGLFSGGTNCCQGRDFDQASSTDLSVVSYGASAAYRLTDRFSLGLGLVYYDGSLSLDSALYTIDDPTDILGSPTSFRSEQVITSVSLGFDDEDYGVTGGFLWKINDRWSLGGNYRGGPEFDYGGSSMFGPAFPLDPPPEGIVGEFCCLSAQLPDVYGLGVSFRPLENLMLAFEWDRVEYSVTLESVGVTSQSVDDADELRLGVEYLFLHSNPLVALRGGAWLDPDHAAQATENVGPIVEALLPGGEDEMHYSLGVGLAFKRFQIDAAIDLSDRVDTVSISGIYGF